MSVKNWMTAVCFLLISGCVTSIRSPTEPVAVTADPQLAATNTAPRASLADGQSIADLMNKNYNETTTSCTEYGTGKTRGYYFCTGVLARTTDNGNFNPWEPSSTALQLRATSFSWIRHDLNTRAFYKRAGFLLLSPADVLAGVIPGATYPMVNGNVVVTCVYPFDAHTTRTMNRNYLGCDFEGTGLGHPNIGHTWGSCDNKLGLTTAAQWNNHFISSGQVNYRQCSWNADNPQGWRNAIASHASFPTGQSSWNEVMFFNFGPNASPGIDDLMAHWIVAFFYDPARSGSLSDAQAFQAKLATVKNRRVPILKLDFNAPAAQRFQFNAADQVHQYYP